MLYRTCKRMIERGNLEGMSTKLDVFYQYRGECRTDGCAHPGGADSCCGRAEAAGGRKER